VLERSSGLPSSDVGGAAMRGSRPVADSRASILYDAERTPLGPLDSWRLLVKSWPFIGRHRRLVVIKTVLAISSLTFFLMAPWPIKIVIDNVIDGRPLTGIPARILTPMVGHDRALLLIVVSMFLLAAVILVGMIGDDTAGLNMDVRSGGLDQAGTTSNDANDGWSLWNGLFGYLEARVTINLTQRINHSVRTAVYERFIRSPIGMFADQKVGDAIFRVINDSASIGSVLYDGVLAPSMSIVMFVLALIVLWAQFSNERIIPILAGLTLPLIAIISGLFGRLLRDQSQRMRERGAGVMAAFEERVAQVQLIKAFGNEKREAAAVDSASWQSYRATLRMIAIAMVLMLFLTPAVGALALYGLYYLMNAVIEQRLTLGDVILLASYGALLANPMARIGGTWANLQAPIAGLRRIHSVLDSLAENAPNGYGNGLTQRIGEQIDKRIERIELRDLSVGYGDAAVIHNVSVTLRAGELTALAGPSGCGKTTLMYSIPRFIEPISGAILFDGIDSHAIAPDSIRARLGFVFQQESLFSMSIAENISYGSPGASDSEIREAAAMANAAEFIERLPDGYATQLGRRGARLSVGQKQRIAIARALLRRPDIMVLDEPTAPLDPSSETELIRTLRELARDRIVVIVAHRADTLVACDRVLFVHGGTIFNSGRHRELLDSCPEYAAYQARNETEISS
jgi:ATP-binding cassette subfamily B protein